MNLREQYEEKQYQQIVTSATGMQPSAEDADTAYILADSFYREKRYDESIVWQEFLVGLRPLHRHMERLCTLYRLADVSADKWGGLLETATRNGESELEQKVRYYVARKKGASVESLLDYLEPIVFMDYDEELYFEAVSLYSEKGDMLSAKEYADRICTHTKDSRVTERVKKLLESSAEKATSPEEERQKKDEKKNGENSENSGLQAAKARLQKEKNRKKRKVSGSIEEYFRDVIGMKEIKERLSGKYAVLCKAGEWSEQGINADSENWNFFIEGEAGSGKSMLTGILCKMMYQFGLVDEEKPVTLHAKTLEEDCSILEQYTGKSHVIVIENIECLCPKTEGEKGKKGKGGGSDIWLYLTALLKKAKRTGKQREFYIFTGEHAPVEGLLEEHPKLSNLATTLVIEPYSLDELHRIAMKLIREKGFRLTEEAKKKLRTELKYEAVADSFANAVTVERMIEQAKENKGRRELETGNTDVYFQVEDFDFGVSTEDELNGLLSELESLIGLESVKERVKKDIHRMLERRERMEKGEDTEKDTFFLHTVLLGAPGTGKTTVARLLGRIYGCLGILRNGSTFVEVGRGDLVGRYQGWSADKTKEVIRSAEGGVLFIDEAYALIQGEGDSFGHEVVNTLVQYAMNYRDRMMIILAGYEKDMERLYEANQGLRRRFPNVLMFEDYTPEQLYEIFLLKCKGRYTVHRSAELSLRQLITRYSKLRGYENGGGIDIHLERLAGVISTRNAESTDNDGTYRNTILKEDVDAVLRDSKSRLPELEDLCRELDSMVGLQAVKKTVREAIRTQKYRKLVAEQMKVPVEVCPEHMLFVGPPGTGKSTVAKLLTKIYCALGVVKDPNRCVTVTKADLNSKYVGGALEAAKKKIEEARGGVLFIDEAYSLVQDEQDSNGIQVLTTLMYAIEEYRGEILLIMAGYKEQLDEMIRKYNPGMASRIAKTVCFEPYTVEELVKIFYEMKKVDGITYEIEPGLEPLVEEVIKQRMAEFEAEGKEFGNARGVRNLKNEAVNRLRMRCTTEEALREPKNLTTICKEDLTEIYNTKRNLKKIEERY